MFFLNILQLAQLPHLAILFPNLIKQPVLKKKYFYFPIKNYNFYFTPFPFNLTLTLNVSQNIFNVYLNNYSKCGSNYIFKIFTSPGSTVLNALVTLNPPYNGNISIFKLAASLPLFVTTNGLVFGNPTAISPKSISL